MRWLLVLLLLPVVAATEPLAPVEGTLHVSGTPNVGQTVVLEAAATAVRDDAPLSLLVPDWVEVEGPQTWTPTEGGTQQWRLTSRDEGAWKASLTHQGDGMTHGICCAYGYALGGVAGTSGTTGQPPGLPAEADVSLQKQATADGFRLTYAATPRHDWMAGGALHVVVSRGGMEHADEGRDGARVVVDLPLGENETVGLHVRAWWTGAWEHPLFEQPAGASFECRNLQLLRQGDRLLVESDHSCETRSDLGDPPGAGIPAPGPLPVVAVLAAALLLRRR